MAGAAPIYRCTVCHTVYSAGERFCPLDAGTITAEGDTDPRVGKTIDGRYFVRRLIGRGGMGAVYEADHVGLDKRVAIKFLAINKTDRDALARFRREAKIASKIVHEHVVQIFDVGTADADTDFIVMEFLEGRDLAAVLKDGGPMDPDRVVSIARKVLRGLRSIHQAGIVHRDIKPANILLSPRDDDRDFVKIMDFGISRQIHGDTITNTGAIIGTPEYMAPEQLLADNIDQRADLYAVGIMMYRMVTGKLPFTSTTFDRAAAANPYVPVPSLAAVIPAAIADAIAKATMKDADERFSDAQAFLAALEGHGLTAKPRESSSPTAAASPGARVLGTEETRLPMEVAQTEIAPSTAEAARASGLASVSGVTAPAKRTNPSVPVIHAIGSPSQLQAPTVVTRSRTGMWIMLGLVIAGAAITIAILATRGGEPDRVALQPPPPAPPSLPAGNPQQPTASPSSADKQKGLVAKGRAAEAAGNLAEALEAYNAAYALEPTAEIAFHLGEINEKLGNNAEASQAFQRYLHLAKDASDKDLVVARIAKLEKAASGSATPPPTTPPPAGKPATTWKVNHGEKNDGLEECHCLPFNGPDTQSMCAELGPSLCNCRNEGNNALCSTPPVACQPNQGNCNSSGFECTDGVFDKLHLKGKMDDACRGYVTWEANKEEDGKLFCDVCANQKFNRLFRGHHGDVCYGYYRRTGQRLEGRLWCKYP